MRAAQKTKKGFSIGEVLVAMFILLIGIVDAVFLTVRSVNDLGNSRDSVVATLLAQEGTELVRNVRDNNVTEPAVGITTHDCLPGRCTAFERHAPGYEFPAGNENCTADYTLRGVGALTCSSSSGELYRDENTGFFSHTPGGNLYRNFRRKIRIEYGTFPGAPSNAEDYIDVTSVVIYSSAQWSDVDFSNIEATCLKSKNCVFAQNRLTSWINYGE